MSLPRYIVNFWKRVLLSFQQPIEFSEITDPSEVSIFLLCNESWRSPFRRTTFFKCSIIAKIFHLHEQWNKPSCRMAVHQQLVLDAPSHEDIIQACRRKLFRSWSALPLTLFFPIQTNNVLAWKQPHSL